MIALATVGIAAQVADLLWQRDDPRVGSPASAVFTAALCLLLALYPNGRPVPRWMVWVAALTVVLFVTNLVAGPDVAKQYQWPLPIAPLLLLLVVGGQGYRYWRRSSADEREAARWPLLGLLLLLTLVLPPDLLSLALTGRTLTDPPPALGIIIELGFLLPSAGFLAGLLAPPTELVDRLLALWLVVVSSAVALGALFAAALALLGLALEPPWPAALAAAVAVLASVWVIPLARRLARRIVFRGRREAQAAVAELTRQLQTAMDPQDIATQLVDTVRDATGASAVRLCRSGQSGSWAQSGEPGPQQDGSDTTVGHLGLPVATLTVWPRHAESRLTTADLRLIDALVAAAAPALHGARLTSAFPELTERERQVLAGIVRGLPNAAIAARLGVSGKTVANYVSIVLTKLRVPDKERAAELARRRTAELG